MFPDIWYIDKLPMNRLKYAEQNQPCVPWFVALVADIKERGMLSPILVSNANCSKYYVRHGNNRVQALQILEYEHLPALSFGMEPDVEATKLESLAECQAYLADGIIGYNAVNNRDQFKINSCMNPQYMKYPDGL